MYRSRELRAYTQMRPSAHAVAPRSSPRVGAGTRDRQLDLRARAHRAPDAQVASDRFRPFTHAGQAPVAIRQSVQRLRIDPATIVADQELKRMVAVADVDIDALRPCVAERIAKRLRRHPVGFVAHDRMKFSRVPFHVDGDSGRGPSIL